MISPCIDCPARHTACHDSCDKYAAFVAEVHAKKAWLKQKREQSYVGFMNYEQQTELLNRDKKARCDGKRNYRGRHYTSVIY